MPTGPLRKASTIILYRQHPKPEVYMLQRSPTASFMPNALVFPGGALDDQDTNEFWQKSTNINDDVAGKAIPIDDHRLAHALMVAAVRETFEEAGILLALSHLKSTQAQDLARVQLNAGTTSFQQVVEDLGLTLNLAALTFISRWITPKVERRRFDAYFFLAEVPSGDLRESADGNETLKGRWMSPLSILEAHSARKNLLAPPTLRALETLSTTPFSQWGNLKRDHTDAVCPQLDATATVPRLVLPNDPAYQPAGDVINRFERHDGYWVSNGTGF
jgi:8-oxo-dGTP pyrophosphatase MutT (NUDIX family)